jgi:prolyl-tRNA synthetase
VGALVMTHSDDEGLVLPPAVAPVQVVIVPVMKDKDKEVVMNAVDALHASLKPHVRVIVDDRDNMRPGAKFFEWERKGVPLRMEVGPRDVKNGAAFCKRRTGGDKFSISFDGASETVLEVLQGIQEDLLAVAKARVDAHTFDVETEEAFIEGIEQRPGFYKIPWGGDDADEVAVKDKTRATLRCFPLDQPPVDGLTCPLTGKPAREWALFSRAY